MTIWIHVNTKKSPFNFGLTIYNLIIIIHFLVSAPTLCCCSSSKSCWKSVGLEGKRGKRMGFIMEFAENLVLRLMEDPKERDRKFREHLYDLKDRCNKTKEMWSLPLRPYGFWTFDRHNSQIFWDSQISQVPGRRDPYDDLLEDVSTKK